MPRPAAFLSPRGQSYTEWIALSIRHRSRHFGAATSPSAWPGDVPCLKAMPKSNHGTDRLSFACTLLLLLSLESPREVHDAKDHHRHRSRPGRRRRASCWRSPRRRSSRCSASSRSPAMSASRRTPGTRCKVVELSGRTDVPVYAGCERPMRRKLVTAEHVHGDDRPRRPRPARAEDEAARRSTASISSSTRSAPSRARHDDALHARPAHQRRHGAGQGAGHRAAHPRDRDDGRRLFRGRQHHAGGRVQRLCRSGGRRRRAPERHPDHHDPARRHPRRAQTRAAPRRASRAIGNTAGKAVSRDALLLRALRPRQIRRRGRAAARPLRHRLAARARRCSTAARSTSPSRRGAS